MNQTATTIAMSQIEDTWAVAEAARCKCSVAVLMEMAARRERKLNQKNGG